MTESVAGVAVLPYVPQSQIAHAFSIQLICRALGMLASVVSVAMTARYLGPGRYGQLTIAVAFVGMWTSFADLGFATVIVRRVTSGRGDLERWSASIAAWRWSTAFRSPRWRPGQGCSSMATLTCV